MKDSKSLLNGKWLDAQFSSEDSSAKHLASASEEGMSVRQLTHMMKEKILEGKSMDDFHDIATEFINKSTGEPELTENRKATEGYLKWTRLAPCIDSSMDSHPVQKDYNMMLKNALGRAVLNGKDPRSYCKPLMKGSAMGNY